LTGKPAQARFCKATSWIAFASYRAVSRRRVRDERRRLPFDGRSDYDAFTQAGIPAGGIFAGAEVVKTAEQVLLYGGTAGDPFDPCYHQLCDTLANISEQGLEEHKDAAVNAVLTFAQTTSAVNGTDKGSSTATKAWDWKGDRLVR
jgi:Zn-dependent M28 family amino/carboxypeptidase